MKKIIFILTLFTTYLSYSQEIGNIKTQTFKIDTLSINENGETLFSIQLSNCSEKIKTYLNEKFKSLPEFKNFTITPEYKIEFSIEDVNSIYTLNGILLENSFQQIF